MSIQWFQIKLLVGVDNDPDGDGEVAMDTRSVSALIDDNRNGVTFDSVQITHIRIDEIEEVKK